MPMCKVILYGLYILHSSDQVSSFLAVLALLGILFMPTAM